MSRSMVSLLGIFICVAPTNWILAQSRTGVPTDTEEPTVTIAVTTFDVDDQTLRLGYKILNTCRYEIWVCDGIEIDVDGPVVIDYEVFLDRDGQTLILRRRLDVPKEFLTGRPLGQKGRYVRLHPGEERSALISLAIPVEPRHVLASMSTDPAIAARLVLEIGYYEGNLPAKIRSILEMAEKLRCVQLATSEIGSLDLFAEYFSGLMVFDAFGGLGGFSHFWQEGADEITVPWLFPAFKGERSLGLVVDPVSVSYGRESGK